MGAPVEWWSPEEVAAYFAKQGGYTLHDYLDPWAIRQGRTPRTILAGQPTDDSELAAALAMSLVEYPDLNEGDLYLRLRDFIHGNNAEGKRKSYLTEKAYGKGGTLEDALKPEAYEDSLARFGRGEVRTPPSNGSLMRCIGIPLAFHRAKLWDIAEMAERPSLVTHRNPSSVAACVAYAAMVNLILSGEHPAEAWEVTRKAIASLTPLGTTAAMKEILAIEPTRPDYETEIKGKEGWVVLSLRVALWASLTATSFRDGIQKAVSVGGDTDTYAAIAGGILGSHFGCRGIPPEWKESLQGGIVMECLASSLYDISESRYSLR
jgi:ADP-ribosylglycohydrolase